MRVVIDLQGAQSESRSRGIGRYSMALALEIARQRGDDEVIVVLNAIFNDTIDPIRAAFDGLLPQENILVWSSPQPVAYCFPENTSNRLQAEACLEAFLADLQPDWVVVTSLFEGFSNNAVTSIADARQHKTAVVLYDLIPYIHRNIYLKNSSSEAWYYEKIDNLRRSDLILSISESSGREAIDFLGFEDDMVVNISTAADDSFMPVKLTKSDRNHLTERYNLTHPFVMYTGGIDHRKNIDALIKAYAALPQELRTGHQLAIVCAIQGQERARLETLALSHGLHKDELILTGYVPESDLVLLYNSCSLFVFPSWHEGFGLPVLEAMKCGRPVLVSNRSSLPEVVGNDAALFNPHDVTDIASKIQKALTDENFTAALIAHGKEQARKFSWPGTAKRAWSALIHAKAEKNPVPVAATLPVGRPRLAYISPLPPEKSGIAGYSSELLRDLTRWYRIDVVVRDPDALNDGYIRANCGVLSVADFRSHAADYDRVLYQFGNSDFHEHMFWLLTEIPGVVVLHDFFLSGIQAFSEAHQLRPHAWTQALQQSHGYKAVVDRFEAEESAGVIYKYPANLPVLQSAIGIIVHSRYNITLAENWYGKGAAENWVQIPLLRAFEVEVNRERARARIGIDDDVLVVCSFGIIAEAKLNHRLLDAWFASKLADDSKAQLIFVGAANGPYGEGVEKRVSEKNGNSKISITGWVDDETYRDWLAAADIAVQLRTLSRGETSAAVFDCMNFGLPTIVNANGSMAELDNEGVLLLPDEFTDDVLIGALEQLAGNRQQRRHRGELARKIIKTHHNPRHCAEQYAKALETFHSRATVGGWGLIRRIASISGGNVVNAANHMAANHPPRIRVRQLLIDVSDTQNAPDDWLPILRDCLQSPSDGYRVELVHVVPGELRCRYARRFTSRLLGIPQEWADDDYVDAWPGDVFIALHETAETQAPFWHEWRRKGITTIVASNDKPLQHPDAGTTSFPPAVTELVKRLRGLSW